MTIHENLWDLAESKAKINSLKADLQTAWPRQALPAPWLDFLLTACSGRKPYAPHPRWRMIAGQLECKVVCEMVAVAFKQMVRIPSVFIAQLLHNLLHFLRIHVRFSNNNTLSPDHCTAQCHCDSLWHIFCMQPHVTPPGIKDQEEPHQAQEHPGDSSQTRQTCRTRALREGIPCVKISDVCTAQ